MSKLKKGYDLAEHIYLFARQRLKQEARELIEEESLNPDKTRQLVNKFLR